MLMPLDGRFDVESPMTSALAQQARALAIDGVPVGSMGFVLVGADLGAAEPSTSMSNVPGRAGGVDLTLEDECGCAFQGRRSCTFSLRTFSPAHRRAACKLALGALTGKEADVFYRPLGLTLRGRIAVGAWDDGNGWADVDLTLSADPIMRGKGAKVALAKGDNVITVGGNAPCPIALDLSPAGLEWVRVVLDGGKFVRVWPAASFGAGAALSIDSESMTCALNGSNIAPTLDSDWLVIAPGRHVLTLSGGTGTASFSERWKM